MNGEQDTVYDGGGSILPEDEEEALRKQIRGRLEKEFEKQHGQQPKPEADSSIAEQLRAERLRIVREEEDRFYAERGLHRYRNHRGEYEWLTKEELDRRNTARRGKRSRRLEHGFWEWLTGEKIIGDLINGLIVLGVLVVAVIVFRRESAPITKYAIEIRSEPPGAAVFVNERPMNATTNATVSVERPGFYTVHLLRPGYRVVPANSEVHVTEGNRRPVLLFTLYPTTNDTMPASPTRR